MFRHWCPSLVVIAVSEPCVRWQGVVPLLGSQNYIESLLAVDDMVAAARNRKECRGAAKCETREVKGRQSRAWKTSVGERSSGLVDK